MNTISLVARLRSLAQSTMPVPGAGQTANRHLRLLEIGREDLELARLAEAHFDALAILAEGGQAPANESIYGVWASEKKGESLILEPSGSAFVLTGIKRFCTGIGIVDRALVTVTAPHRLLVDIDLTLHDDCIRFDEAEWATSEFAETHTATAFLSRFPIHTSQIVGAPDWYIDRPGFWWGACGPAACWAGGALALADFAQGLQHQDPHALAHLGAIQAEAWGLRTVLVRAGCEIDSEATTPGKARILALSVRHLVEQYCTDILRRFARAYGPRPLISEEKISRCYHQLDLYLRQSHAERDLELLGRKIIDSRARTA